MAHGMRTGPHGGYARGGGGGRRDTAQRYALLPLRLFLGITFVYAALDKLTDSAFFHASGTGSIGGQMHAVRDSSAIPQLVDLALKSPTGFGYAIALGELAVGIGTLLGVLARLAAVGGALISLSLWLTISWAAEPYYLGNDLAYLMAWLPLILAGAPYWSVDALIEERRRGRLPGRGR
ncbi:DoxX family protein [Streptomyces sp. NPDC102406]|uniref:DoxX family protein n=1 Tax=Streptomyces sp. NPDC102406 TaxID=3366171 RepID=UPI003822798C